MNKNKIVFFILLTLVVLVAVALLFYLNYEKDYENIKVDALLLKTTIYKGQESLTNIKIRNNDNNLNSLKITAEGEVKDLIEFEKSFKLKPREEKNLAVKFKSDGHPGVYIGKLIISDSVSNSTNKISIPVILEIQSRVVFFDSNINLFPINAIYLPGEKIISEIKIFDLADAGRNKVSVSYYIKDFDGNLINSESESLIVDDKFDHSKTINLPKDINLGSYILFTKIEYQSSVGTSSALFNIVKEKKKNYDEVVFYSFIIFGILVAISLAFFIYFILYRDRLLKELQNQYKREVKRQEELLKHKERFLERKLKTKEEKEVSRKLFREVANKRRKALEKIQKERVEKLRKLRKAKTKESKIKKQIEKWKKQGYEVSILERKIKIPSINDIRKKIKEWKKKGYRTDILERRFSK